MGIEGKRVNAFKADPDLSPFEAAKPSDYSNSGFDQGHLSPVGDMHGDAAAMLESFYMSNMIPQVPGNNRDGWNHFELYVREMAQARGVLYVITGPVYLDKKYETIGASKVAVPSHIYKVIYDPKANAVLSIMVPNIPFRISDLSSYVTNMASLQAATGITFFPGLKMFKNSKSLWEARSSD
jgi:endonuclease G